MGLGRLVAALELGENVPRRRDGEEEDTKVEADRDEVVDLGLGLERPSDGLAERLETSEDTGVSREG